MGATVRFEPSGRTVEVTAGTLLLEAVQRVGLPLARACGADGICGRCGVTVLAGAAGLAPESTLEACAKQRNRVSESMRLACRVAVRGDLVVTAPYW
jgi:2Fe-2S ferredoxin